MRIARILVVLVTLAVILFSLYFAYVQSNP
jgi:hypothetical protein